MLPIRVRGDTPTKPVPEAETVTETLPVVGKLGGVAELTVGVSNVKLEVPKPCLDDDIARGSFPSPDCRLIDFVLTDVGDSQMHVAEDVKPKVELGV